MSVHHSNRIKLELLPTRETIPSRNLEPGLLASSRMLENRCLLLEPFSLWGLSQQSKVTAAAGWKNLQPTSYFENANQTKEAKGKEGLCGDQETEKPVLSNAQR